MNDMGVNLANASHKNPRRAMDNYSTPSEVTSALLGFLNLSAPMSILEPACGSGAISRVLAAAGHTVFSSDIRQTGYGNVQDYLSADPVKGIDAIITNPPFNQSEEFIRKAVTEAPLVAMVLKSQYFHAKKRTQLFKDCPPSFVLALNWRPDFLFGERGGAPTMEILWAVWQKGQADTRYRILERG